MDVDAGRSGPGSPPEDRPHIAHALHDEVQQDLAAILMETEVLRSALRRGDRRALATLERIERLGVAAMASMRRIVRDLPGGN